MVRNLNRRRIVKILKIAEENHRVKTFWFRDTLCSKARPGQFVMVWVIGVDEIPLSLSTIGDPCSITVARVGDATEAMHRLKQGDIIAVRGPYGNGFKVVDKGRVAVVAGGMGLATLLPLMDRLKKSGCRIEVFLGFRSKHDIFQLARVEKAVEPKGCILMATDDGSMGFKGMVSELFELYLREHRPNYDMVYTCGPSAMIRRVYELCRAWGLKIQASLEAYIKCGIGICGSCCIGPYRVCKDGPVFSSSQLDKMPELGLYKRGPDGAKVPIETNR